MDTTEMANDIINALTMTEAEKTATIIGRIIGGAMANIIIIAITTVIICLIVTPFIKRLIKYAIQEYKNMNNKNE